MGIVDCFFFSDCAALWMNILDAFTLLASSNYFLAFLHVLWYEVYMYVRINERMMDGWMDGWMLKWDNHLIYLIHRVWELPEKDVCRDTDT